jgi:hypothetical protein
MFSQALDVPRHTDLRLEIAVQNHRAPIDMTGWTVSIPEADPWTAANAQVNWLDQAQGLAVLTATWTPTTPDTLTFRVKFTHTASQFNDAIFEMIVRYS